MSHRRGKPLQERKGGSNIGLLLLESVRQITYNEYQQLKRLQLLTNRSATLPEVSAAIAKVAGQKRHICILAVLFRAQEKKKKKEYKLSTTVTSMTVGC